MQADEILLVKTQKRIVADLQAPSPNLFWQDDYAIWFLYKKNKIYAYMNKGLTVQSVPRVVPGKEPAAR